MLILSIVSTALLIRVRSGMFMGVIGLLVLTIATAATATVIVPTQCI